MPEMNTILHWTCTYPFVVDLENRAAENREGIALPSSSRTIRIRAVIPQNIKHAERANVYSERPHDSSDIRTRRGSKWAR